MARVFGHDLVRQPDAMRRLGRREIHRVSVPEEFNGANGQVAVTTTSAAWRESGARNFVPSAGPLGHDNWGLGPGCPSCSTPSGHPRGRPTGWQAGRLAGWQMKRYRGMHRRIDIAAGILTPRIC
ncbi:hypothetical protein [Actinoplanes sp. N902-109]|uniref:hypothetical protein n=1 Tax=Actinoplanes sp. (strain N902-109) TaxID=649831 RepID=UPI00032951F6|nr:hypothetical protein [Actinoplanes sp. N902-109]AGL14921.1 hypothetical protein L083_1411 [Actinoplanes sp. N902-109]